MAEWGGNPIWVLAGRELRNVSAFRECPPEERPVVHCPVCKQEVVLKLGDERVHHFAHKPSPELLRCRLENPSAARHFNALVHLSKQLEPAVCRKLKVLTWHGKEPMSFAQDWDEVRTEFPIGKRRADVALLRQGSPIALIEIYHTHEVDFDKQDEMSTEIWELAQTGSALQNDKKILYEQIGANRFYPFELN